MEFTTLNNGIKMPMEDSSYDGAKRAMETSLKKMGLEYLDI